jgi:hypothetical protein
VLGTLWIASHGGRFPHHTAGTGRRHSAVWTQGAPAALPASAEADDVSRFTLPQRPKSYQAKAVLLAKAAHLLPWFPASACFLSFSLR